MNTILVPTDFSNNANNAMRYAVKLAQATDARIVLLHAFLYPMALADATNIVQEVEDMEQSSLKKLHQKANEIKKQLADDRVEAALVPSYLALSRDINNYIRSHDIDLVVLGSRGTSDLVEKVFGSVTTMMVRTCKAPVLVVPSHYRFRDIKKIVISWDSTETFTKPVAEGIRHLISTFKAETILLQMHDHNTFVDSEIAQKEELQVEKKLGIEQPISTTALVYDIPAGIDAIAAKENADMVVIMPHKHSILGRLILGSASRRLAMNTHRPLLVFPPSYTTRKANRLFEIPVQQSANA